MGHLGHVWGEAAEIWSFQIDSPCSLKARMVSGRSECVVQDNNKKDKQLDMIEFSHPNKLDKQVCKCDVYMCVGSVDKMFAQ